MVNLYNPLITHFLVSVHQQFMTMFVNHPYDHLYVLYLYLKKLTLLFESICLIWHHAGIITNNHVLVKSNLTNKSHRGCLAIDIMLHLALM